MEQNNQRNTRKRLNSLILLVAFTAVMLIVSTYAWFSTQKNVTISNLYGKVNVAEGLQISLDGSVWVNEINFDDFDQTNVAAWTVKEDAGGSTKYFNAATTSPTFQQPAGADGGIKNVVPAEFLPVSTTGYKSTADGIGQTYLKMYSGNVVNNNTDLEDVQLLTEESASGYYAFDLFVWNSSGAGASTDKLQLDTTSTITSDNTGTGIENTARVAFALYNNAGDSMSTNKQLSQSDVITGTSSEKTIKDIAIWEPNANAHTTTIVNTNNKLTLTAADISAYELTTSTFASTNKLPTYALTSQTADLGDIEGIYNWATADADGDNVLDATGLAKQHTLQTSNLSTDWTTSVDLISTAKLEENPEATDTTFELVASQYHKIRVYVWIEGQDPDCINAASLGGGLTIDIGFSKPGTEDAS